MSSMGVNQSVRAWLEEAILKSNATLPSSSEGSSGENSDDAPSESSSLFENNSHETDNTNDSTKDLSDEGQDPPATYVRKLVTIREIDSVKHFSKALNLANIGGWTTLVKKSMNFRANEHVLYFEVDSFVPSHIMDKNAFCIPASVVTFNGIKGYRVATHIAKAGVGRSLRHVFTQGQILRIDQFPEVEEYIAQEATDDNGKVDYGFLSPIDLAPMIGVLKWEENTSLPPGTNFKTPSFVMKTDLERVENCPNLFKKKKYTIHKFQETIKVDGATMTCYFVLNTSPKLSDLPPIQPSHHREAVQPNGRFGVCSKNCDLITWEKSNYWLTALGQEIHKKLSAYGKSIAIQGELVGWDIQRNFYGYNKGEYDYFVFSITDIDCGTRWDPKQTELWCQEQGIKHVPVLGYYPITAIASRHQDLVDRAELKPGEGHVYKNCFDNRAFKVLSKWYIMRHGDERAAKEAEELHQLNPNLDRITKMDNDLEAKFIEDCNNTPLDPTGDAEFDAEWERQVMIGKRLCAADNRVFDGDVGDYRISGRKRQEFQDWLRI